MKEFTAVEYLAIDIANHFGLDKETFENRIQWVKDHGDTLESLQAEEPYLYQKAVKAFRNTLKGLPVGHTVALDSVASGMQLMSVMTGCKDGCEITGLVHPDKRMDAYTEITKEMQKILGETVNVSRKHAKEATMTRLYGSVKVPENVFGEDTKELEAFYKALANKASGAVWLLEVLQKAWNKYALYHEWVLPDGFNAYIPNMEKVSTRVDVDELKYSMSIEYYENVGLKKGISLVANTIHSVDAYVLRSMVRLCNYDERRVKQVLKALEIELMDRAVHDTDSQPERDESVIKYMNLWRKTDMVDLVILNHLDGENLKQVPTVYLKKLKRKLKEVSSYPSFEIITVHDSFACHPNHCNRMRYWYKEILAELAESRTLGFILGQLMHNDTLRVNPTGPVADLIRQSNYGLC